VCTAIKNAINGIKLCLSFSLGLNGLKFQAVCLKNAPASGGLRPPDPMPGLRPWTPLGDFCRADPLIWPSQLHLLDPPLPLRNYSLTHSLTSVLVWSKYSNDSGQSLTFVSRRHSGEQTEEKRCQLQLLKYTNGDRQESTIAADRIRE